MYYLLNKQQQQQQQQWPSIWQSSGVANSNKKLNVGLTL